MVQSLAAPDTRQLERNFKKKWNQKWCLRRRRWWNSRLRWQTMKSHSIFLPDARRCSYILPHTFSFHHFSVHIWSNIIRNKSQDIIFLSVSLLLLILIMHHWRILFVASASETVFWCQKKSTLWRTEKLVATSTWVVAWMCMERNME